MKNSVVSIALVLTMVTILPFSLAAAPMRTGDKAPVVEVTTLDGKKVSSQNLKDGEALFLFFWATWCPYCVAEIPKLKDAFSTYGPKGMKFLAVNPGINDSLKKIERYVDKYKLPYPVVHDKGAKITKQFGIMGAPTYIIVDKNGIVQYRGNRMPKDLAERFEKLIKKTDKSGNLNGTITPVSFNK
jgi:peroxiredoxin